MPDRIWVGKFRPTSFNKVGLRHKLPGQDWQAPYKDHIVPLSDPQTIANMKRYSRGEHIQRQELPECSAVYDAVCFARQEQFSCAGIGYIVDKQVKQVLEPFDLGPGGLFPYTIYQADEVTPINEQWWMLGMGAQKRSFLPDKSTHPDLECLFDGKGQKDSLYNTALPPGDDVLAFSPAALEGADLWHEPELASSFCFSDRLGQALQDADLAHWFNLQTARIVN